MEYYIFLSTITAIIIVLAFMIWRKSRNIIFPLGIFIIYYWSLYGAWSIIEDKLGGNSGKSYQYLEQKLFEIKLDNNYLLTLMYYALFIIIIELTLLFLIAPKRKRELEKIWVVPSVSHVVVILMAFLFAGISFWIVRSDILTALSSGSSAYLTVRQSTTSLYTFHLLFNGMAILITLLGAAIWISGNNPLLLSGRGPWAIGIFYPVILIGLFGFNLAIGDRSQLLSSTIAGGIFYLSNSRHPKTLLLLTGGVLALSALSVVNVLRSIPLYQLNPAVIIRSLLYFPNAFQTVLGSNEAFAAHFSMYGVLKFQVPPTMGTSIVTLVASIVPRFILPNRPADIYSYYVDNVGATTGQGYTIHHATGWYLNFGFAGILIGAMLIGGIWAFTYNRLVKAHQIRILWKYIFTVLSPWLFVASLPGLIRTGPEGYKSVLFEWFLIPTFLISLASYHWIILPKIHRFPKNLSSLTE